ncbi:hypothetical protein ACMAZF_20225 (plasmid) [Psychrobium sp. nBUS_13]|uniref:hypothetical protein n=1 Tax=Psychrobium sp. nBUS_13 TaxID=3395319 RepID=UPI003EBA9761
MITLTIKKIRTKGGVFILAAFFSVLPFTSSGNNYAITAMKGEVTFDYSNNDGSYFIGSGAALFEIHFSSASNRAVHIYKDPSTIQKIALAYEADSFAEIGDAKRLDYSSRTRTPHINEIVVLVNKSGYYAAIKIQEVRARSHKAKRDKVTFSYVINDKQSSVF